MKALGERTFKSDRLKEVAILKAFWEGTRRGNQGIVELYCEHPAITSREYAEGLYQSWNNGKPNQVFPFLLKQADQGDLDLAKKGYAYGDYSKFHLAIDEAFKAALPAGSRIISVEKVQCVLEVLVPITRASDEYGPGRIIKDYLLGEKENTKKHKLEGQEASTMNRTD